METTEKRYNHLNLIKFTKDLLHKYGLPADRAKVMAEILIEADLMGHTTHGLQMIALYVRELINGGMKLEGDPKVLNDTGSVISWDGNYLPGPWLVRKAMDLAVERLDSHSVVTMTIQQSHHIGCLAAYPEILTKKGLIMILSCSDPRNKTVAPFGGVTGVYSPNPLAAGFPTESDPIIFDISMSTTSNSLLMRLNKENKNLGHPWLLSAEGELTEETKLFFEDPPATILPLGSLDVGYKGFALGILVEALTNALGGFGRSDNPNRWGASVFMQVINPEAFGGLDHFKKEMQYFKERSVASKPLHPGEHVRLPGQKALELKREQIKSGVVLHPSVMNVLNELQDEFSVELPDPIDK